MVLSKLTVINICRKKKNRSCQYNVLSKACLFQARDRRRAKETYSECWPHNVYTWDWPSKSTQKGGPGGREASMTWQMVHELFRLEWKERNTSKDFHLFRDLSSEISCTIWISNRKFPFLMKMWTALYLKRWCNYPKFRAANEVRENTSVLSWAVVIFFNVMEGMTESEICPFTVQNYSDVHLITWLGSTTTFSRHVQQLENPERFLLLFTSGAFAILWLVTSGDLPIFASTIHCLFKSWSYYS